MPRFEGRQCVALDAAERMFAKDGYGCATMRDIATAAEMSISGLYHYLPSKQRALALVCERAFSALVESLDRALAASPVPRAQLLAFVHGHIDFVIRQPNAYRVLLHSMDALAGTERIAVQKLRRLYFERAVGLVATLQEAQPSPISPRVATAALFGMMNWLPMWYHGRDESDATHLAHVMVLLFLRGVVPSQALSETVS
ncbi:MAG: TetR/AcrR family transcriptional regulator [Vulcanimicrobiaceae bacterium]